MSCLLETQQGLQPCPWSHCILVWDTSSLPLSHSGHRHPQPQQSQHRQLSDLWQSWVKAASPSPQLPSSGLSPVTKRWLKCHYHKRQVQEHNHVTLAQTFRHTGSGGDNGSTHLEVAEIQVHSHNRLPSKPHLPPARENKTSEILKYSQSVSNHLRNRIWTRIW